MSGTNARFILVCHALFVCRISFYDFLAKSQADVSESAAIAEFPLCAFADSLLYVYNPLFDELTTLLE